MIWGGYRVLDLMFGSFTVLFEKAEFTAEGSAKTALSEARDLMVSGKDVHELAKVRGLH